METIGPADTALNRRESSGSDHSTLADLRFDLSVVASPYHQMTSDTILPSFASFSSLFLDTSEQDTISVPRAATETSMRVTKPTLANLLCPIFVAHPRFHTNDTDSAEKRLVNYPESDGLTSNRIESFDKKPNFIDLPIGKKAKSYANITKGLSVRVIGGAKQIAFTCTQDISKSIQYFPNEICHLRITNDSNKIKKDFRTVVKVAPEVTCATVRSAFAKKWKEIFKYAEELATSCEAYTFAGMTYYGASYARVYVSINFPSQVREELIATWREFNKEYQGRPLKSDHHKNPGKPKKGDFPTIRLRGNVSVNHSLKPLTPQRFKKNDTVAKLQHFNENGRILVDMSEQVANMYGFAVTTGIYFPDAKSSTVFLSAAFQQPFYNFFGQKLEAQLSVKDI